MLKLQKSLKDIPVRPVNFTVLLNQICRQEQYILIINTEYSEKCLSLLTAQAEYPWD